MCFLLKQKEVFRQSERERERERERDILVTASCCIVVNQSFVTVHDGYLSSCTLGKRSTANFIDTIGSCTAIYCQGRYCNKRRNILITHPKTILSNIHRNPVRAKL